MTTHNDGLHVLPKIFEPMKKQSTMATTVVRYRSEDGLFSNVIVCMFWMWGAVSEKTRRSVALGWWVDQHDVLKELFCGKSTAITSTVIDNPDFGTGTYDARKVCHLLSYYASDVARPWCCAAVHQLRTAPVMFRSISEYCRGTGMFNPSRAVWDTVQQECQRIDIPFRPQFRCESDTEPYIIAVHGRYAFHYSGVNESGREDVGFRHMQAMARAALERVTLQAAKQPDRPVLVLLCSCMKEFHVFFVQSFKRRFRSRGTQIHGMCSGTTRDWMESPDSGMPALRDALVDAVMMAMADEIVGGSSNVLMYARCLNPDVSVTVPQHLATADGK